jgi:hypothetical protein
MELDAPWLVSRPCVEAKLSSDSLSRHSVESCEQARSRSSRQAGLQVR